MAALKIWRRFFVLFGPLSLSSMAGMSIGAALFMVSTVVALARGWQEWGRSALRAAYGNPYGYLSLAFFLVAFLSLVFGGLFPPLGIEAAGLGELKKFHHFLYPPLVALALLRSNPGGPLERHPFWKAWGAMGVGLFFVAVAQFFARDLFPEAWLGNRFFRVGAGIERFHAQGLMFFHLSFAACMSFVAAAGLARLLWPLREDGPRARAFWGTLGVMAVAAVYFSFSRIALGGLVALICTLGFLRRPLAGVFALAACLVVAATLWFSMPSLRDRFHYANASNGERVVMWETAWEMFKDRPLLGVGFGRTGKYSPAYSDRLLGHHATFTSHAHNNVLDQMGSTGALGLGVFLAWWGLIFLWAARAFRGAAAEDRWLPAAALAGFVAFHVNGLTQVNFWDGKSEHTMMLWVGVVLALELRRRAQSPARASR